MARHAELRPRKLPSGMWRVDVAASFAPNGKRQKKDFETEARAKTYITGLRSLLAQPIVDTEDQRREAFALRARLPEGRTLTDAVDVALSIWERDRTGRTFSAVLAQMIQAKRDRGVSARHLRDIAQKCGRFAEQFGERPLTSIERGEIREWLGNLRVVIKGEGDVPDQFGGFLAPESRNCYRRVLGGVFSFALREGYVPNNPVSAVDTVKTVRGAVGIYTPAEARRLLRAASAHCFDNEGRPTDLSSILPAVAIGFFAGLRPEETYPLDWSLVDFEHRQIDITKGKTAAARPRFVPINDTLLAWLEPYREVSGRVCPATLWRTLGKVRRAASLDHWPKDVLRHSFASYTLPIYPDVHALAAIMGNSVEVIHSHYRQPVRAAVAREFWSILPDTQTP